MLNSWAQGLRYLPILLLVIVITACEHELKIGPEFDRFTVDEDVSHPSPGIWAKQNYEVVNPSFEITTLMKPGESVCKNTVCYLKSASFIAFPLFPLGLLLMPFSEESSTVESRYLKIGMFGKFAGSSAAKDLFARKLEPKLFDFIEFGCPRSNSGRTLSSATLS